MVLACDGLKDFVPEKEIVSIVGKQEQAATPLAQQLVDSALKRMNKNANDNVTVVVVEVA